MKKLFKYLIGIVSILTVVGCGGSGGSDSVLDAPSTTGHNIRMEKNRAYDLQKR